MRGENAPFNPEMLVLARDARQMTQTDLAAACNTTQGRISKIENGLLDPPEDLIEDLARELRFRVSFFRHQDRVYGLPLHLPSRFHRRRKRIPKWQLDQVHAEVTIRRIEVTRLLPAARIEADEELPRLDIDEYEGDAAEVARVVRASWRLPRGPIKSVVGSVEGAGVVVVPCDFGSLDIDGIGESYREQLPPMIFVNSRMPVDRLRWTLAHELGHLVMHALPSPSMEDQANEFAGEFLCPGEEIRPHLTKVSLPKLAALKPVWGVSMGALLMRAKALGLVRENRYRYLWSEMSRRGYRRREPPELDLPGDHEEPTLLRDLLSLHTEELGYSREELSELFGVLPEDLQSRYFEHDRTLRLVG